MGSIQQQLNHKQKIEYFICSELKSLLESVNLSKSGLKNELKNRCLGYLNTHPNDVAFLGKISDIYNSKYRPNLTTNNEGKFF